jgi:hypothetical protein
LLAVPEVLERLTSTHEVVLNVEETATVVRAESIDHMHAAAVASANRNVEEEAGDGALVTMADAFPSLDTREVCGAGQDAADWIGLGMIGLDCGLDWIGLDWIGLDWIGLDWIGLGVYRFWPKFDATL